MPEKIISLVQSLCGQPKPRSFLWRSFSRVNNEKWCSSTNFVTEMVTGTALSSYWSGNIDSCSNRNPYDLKYAEDIMLLNEDSNKLLVFLDRLKDCVDVFWMRFAPSNCTMLLRDWIVWKPNLVLAGEE